MTEDEELRDATAASEIRARIAALPAEIAPPRDLWPAIAARTVAHRAPARRFPVLVAAALGAAAGLVLTILLLRSPRFAPETPGESLLAGGAPPAAPAVALAAYAETGRELDAVRDELRRAIDARSEALPPETRELVFESLATIERAIADIEAALARQPADPALARAYVDYRAREIALLRQANRLAARL
jgi:hypothetical protein